MKLSQNMDCFFPDMIKLKYYLSEIEGQGFIISSILYDNINKWRISIWEQKYWDNKLCLNKWINTYPIVKCDKSCPLNQSSLLPFIRWSFNLCMHFREGYEILKLVTHKTLDSYHPVLLFLNQFSFF